MWKAWATLVKCKNSKGLIMTKVDTSSKLKNLVFVLFIFSVSFLRGQTFYALQIDRKIRFEAKEITAKYQPHLVMGVDQSLQFQSTVARFLVKKRAVERDDNLSPKAKYRLLRRLSSRETSEMADVLESYRLQEYMRIKADIQPLPKPIDFGVDLVVQD